LITQNQNVAKIQNTRSIILIAKALEHISNNYSYSTKIDTLTALCNMSITNFRRLFKTAMGVPLLEYIVSFRIQIASILLKYKEHSILDISLKVGYASLSSFNRHFKRLKGVPPRKCRQ